MKGRTAFITGATGFIGGRIAERLWLDYGIAARCLVRNFPHAARLARLPVEMVKGDILDRDLVRMVLRDCDIIFHCAYGNTGDPDLNSRINEEGSRILGETALEYGAERFLYLSSVAVYGSERVGMVNEETPVQYSDDSYGNSKIRAEAICTELAEQGLPVVIFRPAVVFGPFSPIWTVGAIERIRIGGWDRIEGVDGLCNPVYIDDLVDSLLLSVKHDHAVGNTFIIAGRNTITWNDFFSAHAELAGLPAPAEISSGKWQILNLVRAPMQRSLNLARRILERQLVEIYYFLRERFPGLTSKLDRLVRGGIRGSEIDRFSMKTEYSIAKAEKMLGYSPRIFAEGMSVTAEWLRHHGYI
jgi:nucleoside-diphosphate-sugar epimerase